MTGDYNLSFYVLFLTGALFDATGNYNLSFFVAGGMLAMAGIICFPLRRIARWQHNKKLKLAQAVRSDSSVAKYDVVNQGEVNGKVPSV